MELSNLTEFVEKGPRGKDVKHTRVDPEKATIVEELVKLGLAYIPSQADRNRPSFVVLTPLGEATAVLAAKSSHGPTIEVQARKYSTLDKTFARLSEAMAHFEDGLRTDEFRCFNPEERRRLKTLHDETRALQSKVARFRDSFEPHQDASKRVRGRVSTRRSGRSLTRSVRP
ncbi:MAG: hypothetical protein JRM82_00770 [Nitrososphaerota archaeon]|nr:hypothetical protein [Nitrososphaerota archaeon]